MDLKYDYEEVLAKNPAFKTEDLTQLRGWINEQEPSSLIPKNITDKQLLLFYSARDSNLEETKKCIKCYYMLKNSTPELFDNRHFDDGMMQETVDHIQCFIFPEKTDEGHTVFYHGYNDMKSENFHIVHDIKIMLMTFDAFLYENGPSQFIIVYDLEGFAWGHLFKIPFSIIKKYSQYLQDGSPFSFDKMIVLNCNVFFDKLVTLLKPIIKSAYFEKLLVHRRGDDYEAFFKKCLPKRCVPKNFGGESSDLQTLHQGNCEKLKSLRSYFDEEETCRHDYKKSVNVDRKQSKWFSFMR